MRKLGGSGEVFVLHAAETRGKQTISIKGQTVNISGFAGSTVFVARLSRAIVR